MIDQGVKRERLDQGQTQNQSQLNAGTSGRIAGQTHTAAAVALPCAKAQMPEAKAMENPAAMAIHLPSVSAPPCAKAGTANASTAAAPGTTCLAYPLCFSSIVKYRQWVVDTIPCRRPHAERLKISGR